MVATVTSSLLDLELRPTRASIGISSVAIVEKALAAYLSEFIRDGSIGLMEVDVYVKALRFDKPMAHETGDPLNLPSTIFTTSITCKFRDDHHHQSSHNLNELVTGALGEASADSLLHDLLASSTDPILREVTEASIGPTSYAVFATGETSFVPPFTPAASATLVGDEIILDEIILLNGENSLPPTASAQPYEIALVVLSAMIFFAMSVIIYLHKSKRSPSHAEAVNYFFGSDIDRSVRRIASMDQDQTCDIPINEAQFSSDGSGMVHSSAPQKYNSSSGGWPGDDISLTTVLEDERFRSPSYFDSEGLRHEDCSQGSMSEDVFGIDVDRRANSILHPACDDQSVERGLEGGDGSRWSQAASSGWLGLLQTIRVVGSNVAPNEVNKDGNNPQEDNGSHLV